MPFWPFARRSRPPLYSTASPTADPEGRAAGAFYAKRWAEAERLYREVVAKADAEGQHVARNMLGRICEHQERVDDAIAYYEANIREPLPTPWPFERLAIIYRRQRLPDEERRVLTLGARVLNELQGQWCRDRLKKMN